MRQTLITNLCDVSGTSNQLMDTHQISSDDSKGNTCILYTVDWIIFPFQEIVYLQTYSSTKIIHVHNSLFYFFIEYFNVWYRNLVCYIYIYIYM